MSKELKRRIEKLELQEFGGLEPVFIIVRYFSKDCANKKPIAYSREHDGPQVRKQLGETDEGFFERAKTELFGESAKEPGIHVLSECP
jgi:hypothetical protein